MKRKYTKLYDSISLYNCFSFTKGAYAEADRAKREDNIDIQLLTADELIS